MVDYFVKYFSICLIYNMIKYIESDNRFRVLTPIDRETDLEQGFRQNMRLTDEDSRYIADMIVKKNFSILIEFQQREHSAGSFFSVYAGHSKVLEIVTDGLKNELRIRWRRGSTIATRFTSNIQFDDEEWHKVIFEMQGPYAQMTKDCEPFLSESFPELEFGLLNRLTPVVWITQGSATDSLLLGKIRQFKIKEGSFFNDMCSMKTAADPSSINQAAPGTELETLKRQTDELRQKMQNMENQIAKLTNVVENLNKTLLLLSKNRTLDEREDPGTTTLEPDVTRGVCPNCYEYVLHKANYLETEFKRWRETIQKLDGGVKNVILAQRGCMVNNTAYQDGQTWIKNCVQCVCHSGKVQCHPVGCRPLNCSFPIKKPAHCCPSCGQGCFYMQKLYDHGQTFYPKSCVKCQCLDSETFCQFETQVTCPPLSCAENEKVSLENRCCPICVGSNFCAQNPCHKFAKCTNKQHSYECSCLPGYFGDGEMNCFDVDECYSSETLSKNQFNQLLASNSTPPSENTLAIGMDHQKNAGPCSSGSRCINTPGSFYCECLPGYTKINDRLCFDHIGNT